MWSSSRRRPSQGDSYIVHERPSGALIDGSCCTLKSGLRLCQGHAPSVLLPTKDLCGGDLVQEAGDSFAINMAQGHPHGFAKPSSGCTGISSASTKPPLLLFLGVTLVPSSADSPSWLQLTPYFHSHTHLPVKSLDVQAFLGRAHHKVFYGKKEFRRKQKQS